jgi:hypothetical protein
VQYDASLPSPERHTLPAPFFVCSAPDSAPSVREVYLRQLNQARTSIIHLSFHATCRMQTPCVIFTHTHGRTPCTYPLIHHLDASCRTGVDASHASTGASMQAGPPGDSQGAQHVSVDGDRDDHGPSCSHLCSLGLLNGVDMLGGKGTHAHRSNSAANRSPNSTADFGSNSSPNATANIRSLTIPNLSDSSTNIFVSNSGSNSGTHCGPDDKGSNTVSNT